MKLKKVKIEGMHNVTKAEYDLNDVTYLHGPNGAGKSTVLQAIQLALLGYIPGMNKTKDAIFRNANGRSMAITLELADDANNVTTVERVVANTGKSVTCGVTLNGAITSTEQLAQLIGDLELPIFNFNEFVGMTANKLKDWFISFLPNSAGEIDWADMLKKSAKDMEILDDTLIPAAVDKAMTCEHTGVDQVRYMNTYFKDLLSFKKTELTRVQSTIQSLIYYDDCDTASMSEDQLKCSIQTLNAKKDSLMQDIAAISRNANIEAELDKYVASAGDIAGDEEYRNALKIFSDLTAKKEELTLELSEIDKRRDQAQMYIADHNKLLSSKGVCTYTGNVCESIVASFEAIKAKDAELNEVISECTNKHNELVNQINKINIDLNTATKFISERKASHEHVNRLRSMLIPVSSNASADELNAELAQLNDEIKSLESTWVKLQANNKYNKLIEDLTTQKFAIEQTIDILKLWIKLTDANGLQSEMMTAPFISFAEDMNVYISKLFGKDVAAKFNLENKANSFSFGIVRDQQYIPFDLLSSGEKCIYTLALMICISSKSNSDLKVILIDDLFDHLDDENMKMLFESLNNIHDIQFIIAGVKDFTSTSDNQLVIEI